LGAWQALGDGIDMVPYVLALKSNPTWPQLTDLHICDKKAQSCTIHLLFGYVAVQKCIGVVILQVRAYLINIQIQFTLVARMKMKYTNPRNKYFEKYLVAKIIDFVHKNSTIKSTPRFISEIETTYSDYLFDFNDCYRP
jgi:hypothetical protein